MPPTVLTIVSGALAGLVHVLTGPDHLAAVAPMAAADGRRGWFAGWTWGLGHAGGVVCVAVLAILLRVWLPPIAEISQWSERLVGAALIAVGMWALRRSAGMGADAHSHGSLEHGHLHVGRGPRWLRHLGHAHASFYLGVLHGVAGSSHFLGVLPALALPTQSAALSYIAAFGVGTVASMTGFAATVGFAGRRLPQRGLMGVSAVAALVIGVVWLVA